MGLFTETGEKSHEPVGNFYVKSGQQSMYGHKYKIRAPLYWPEWKQAMASASLDDVDFLREIREAVIDGRVYLHQAICDLGLDCLPSQTNFVTILDPPMGANELADALLRRGYIVRAMGAFGLPNGVRISVGTQAENEKFVAVLQEVLEEK